VERWGFLFAGAGFIRVTMETETKNCNLAGFIQEQKREDKQYAQRRRGGQKRGSSLRHRATAGEKRKVNGRFVFSILRGVSTILKYFFSPAA